MRLARAINKVLERKGRLFAERYHARVRTWLLATGWRKHGLLAFDEVPG